MSVQLPPSPNAPTGCMLRGAGILAAGVGIVLFLMLWFFVIGPYFIGPAAAPSGGGGNQLQSQAAGSGAGGATPTPPSGPGPVPAISERYFDSGTSHVAVTGGLTLSGDLAIDTVSSSVTNQGRALIVFGPPDPNALLVVVTFNEPEDAVTVTQGTKRATGIDSDCAFTVQVTDALVSGHVSCPSVDAFDGDQAIGTASIELDFSAESLPE
jgi:hypothetical protein